MGSIHFHRNGWQEYQHENAFLTPPKMPGVVDWYQGCSGGLGLFTLYFNRSYLLVQNQDYVLEGEQECFGLKRR